MRDENFEWDDKKAASNRVKHGVSFEMARCVFDDPFLFEWINTIQGHDEVRFAALGMVEQRTIFVAYTLRDGRIRIISARRATAFERRTYDVENKI